MSGGKSTSHTCRYCLCCGNALSPWCHYWHFMGRRVLGESVILGIRWPKCLFYKKTQCSVTLTPVFSIFSRWYVHVFERQISRRLFSGFGLPLPLNNPRVLPGVPHTNARQNSCLPKLLLQTVSCCALCFASWAFVSSQKCGVGLKELQSKQMPVLSWLRFLRSLQDSADAHSVCLNCPQLC